MRIAILNETSAADKNQDIVSALAGFDHEVFNLGMHKGGEPPELSYMETGFMAALVLNTGYVDFVVGGCGTGQGFANSVLQYPNVSVGVITEPLDAWLFAQINGGNCISLALNKGYGWAGGMNIQFIFEKLFSVEFGIGYPEHRKEPQRVARENLKQLSGQTHYPFAEIIGRIDPLIVKNAVCHPNFSCALEEILGCGCEVSQVLKKVLEE